MNINLSKFKAVEIAELYSEIIKELKKRKIIRSKNIIGDLGEYLIINYFNSSNDLPNLTLSQPSNKSYDAIDDNNKKYAIKTTSTKTTGVFYGLEPKGSKLKNKQIFDYAVVLKLNEIYKIEKIILLDWEQFLEAKKWHSTMKAWNLTLSKKIEKNATVIHSN